MFFDDIFLLTIKYNYAIFTYGKIKTHYVKIKTGSH